MHNGKKLSFQVQFEIYWGVSNNKSCDMEMFIFISSKNVCFMICMCKTEHWMKRVGNCYLIDVIPHLNRGRVFYNKVLISQKWQNTHILHLRTPCSTLFSQTLQSSKHLSKNIHCFEGVARIILPNNANIHIYIAIVNLWSSNIALVGYKFTYIMRYTLNSNRIGINIPSTITLNKGETFFWTFRNSTKGLEHTLAWHWNQWII